MKPSPVRSRRSTRRSGVSTGNITRKSLPTPTGLPNINILKLMNGFVSFRSTVHDLSQSLQRLESMMDHTTKLFSVGQNVRSGREPFRPQLPKPPVNRTELKDAFKDEDIPIIKLPKTLPPRSPFLRLLQYVDMGKVLTLLQTPIMRNLFTQLFAAKPAVTHAHNPTSTVKRSRANTHVRRKNVRRKRVRP